MLWGSDQTLLAAVMLRWQRVCLRIQNATHQRAKSELLDAVQLRGVRAAKALVQNQSAALLALIFSRWADLLTARTLASKEQAWKGELLHVMRCRGMHLMEWHSRKGRQTLLLYQAFAGWLRQLKSLHFSRALVLHSAASSDATLLRAVLVHLHRYCSNVKNQYVSDRAQAQKAALFRRENGLMQWHQQRGTDKFLLSRYMSAWLELVKAMHWGRSFALASADSGDSALLSLVLSVLYRYCAGVQQIKARDQVSFASQALKGRFVYWHSKCGQKFLLNQAWAVWQVALHLPW